MLRILLTAALVATILAGCQIAEEQASYDVASVALPKGHPQAGREVFLEKRCTSCHRVAWETDFPEPTEAVNGPEFADRHSFLPAGYLVTSITAPSYHVREPYVGHVGGGLSPMADYSAAITVREVVDVIAYLRTQGGDRPVPVPRPVARS
jgi:mono/diheme cytochrome c family protein